MERPIGSAGPWSTPPAPSARRVIAGGIVAHNDERRIEGSIRSLLSQPLPDGTEWGRIWVVASGCTDRTVEIAHSLAESDPRLRVIVERERRGKAAALREVLRRAEGESLILLNSDAIAAPGAVRALLDTAAGKPRPFAVMGRPTVAASRSGGWEGSLRWMWDLHHELHLEMLADGRGAHLSDELLLVSLPAYPWIEEGIINDGSYCAVWLRGHDGSCWYAPEAHVAVDIPATPAEHLRQRRRIHVGNAQVAAQLGRSPTTLVRYFFEAPSRAVRSLRRTVASDHGVRHLARIALLELVAQMLALGDRALGRDHVLWQRIGPASRSLSAVGATESIAESVRRARVLGEIAREFGTYLTPDQLDELLPAPVPRDAKSREPWAAVARSPGGARIERGRRYLSTGRRIVAGPLHRLLGWVECVGVTGSTAYGEPEEGDDLDFFVVCRPGAVPAFLAATYLALRIERLRSEPEDAPTPCFNYVVDGDRAGRDLGDGRGLLFAREALMARMLVGDAFYRGLLAQAPALGREIPRLYATRTAGAEPVAPRGAPLGVRALSAVVFLPLAAYLQFAGIWRNARARRERREGDVFRTVTTPRRVVFQSRRFDALRARYEIDPSMSAAAPSRIPTAR
jgi:glycosyltransferase involved in cell wall biosynthesis